MMQQLFKLEEMRGCQSRRGSTNKVIEIIINIVIPRWLRIQITAEVERWHAIAAERRPIVKTVWSKTDCSRYNQVNDYHVDQWGIGGTLSGDRACIACTISEEPRGQLKSTITLRSLQSRLAAVLRGETTKPSWKVVAAKGPATRPREISLLIYSWTAEGKVNAPRWERRSNTERVWLV